LSAASFFYIIALMRKTAGGIDRNGLRTWVEVSREAVARNYRLFRSLISKETALMAVVKSNAYGHGLADFSEEISKLGADFIGVDSILEALALRRGGIGSPILVLGYTLPERINGAAEARISVAVSNFEHLKALPRGGGRPLGVHLKVDTGMHRQGFFLKDAPAVVLFFKKNRDRVSLEGLFTHFAAAKNPAFPDYTKQQIAEFKKWQTLLRREGFSFKSHAAATAGTLLFPESHFDMVRIGIGLYGLWPDCELSAYFGDKIQLRPALSWRSVVSEVKELPRGSKVGYDCAETLTRDSVVAVSPVGYWHGYPRALSGIAHTLVRGRRARVLGRVSMDMISIDVTDIPLVRVGEAVTLVGRDGRQEISATELSDLCNTSSYELITRINPLIKRIYI